MQLLSDRKNIYSPTVPVLAITTPRNVNIMLTTVNSQIIYYKSELIAPSWRASGLVSFSKSC